jgi:hypothetical protein
VRLINGEFSFKDYFAVSVETVYVTTIDLVNIAILMGRNRATPNMIPTGEIHRLCFYGQSLRV